jgi:[acyl-carrier-protein] S-malonyltransferase
MSSDHDTSCAFFFPGQGAQKVDMAVDLCESIPRARAIFEKGREVLGFDILGICKDGPEDELNSTRVSQPAIFLHSMAMLEALSERFGVEGACGTGVPAAAAAGLSLGEYSALVFVGAIAFEDALRIVGKRGELMQEACDQREGAMASVMGLKASAIEEVVEAAKADGLEIGISNYNSPAQTVISGAVEAVDTCIERLTAAGARRVIKLRVAGAYHSILMGSATEKMEPLLAELAISTPRIPFFANYSGARVVDPEEIRRGLLRQVENSVRWEPSVRAMIESGVKSGVEIGPGSVLGGLVKNIDRSVAVQPVGTVEALDKIEALPV